MIWCIDVVVGVVMLTDKFPPPNAVDTLDDSFAILLHAPVTAVRLGWQIIKIPFISSWHDWAPIAREAIRHEPLTNMIKWTWVIYAGSDDDITLLSTDCWSVYESANGRFFHWIQTTLS